MDKMFADDILSHILQWIIVHVLGHICFVSIRLVTSQGEAVSLLTKFDRLTRAIEPQKNSFVIQCWLVYSLCVLMLDG